MSDYLRFANGQTVEGSLLVDADDPFADVVDSELYDAPPNVSSLASYPAHGQIQSARGRFAPTAFRPLLPPAPVVVPAIAARLQVYPSRGQIQSSRGRTAPWWFGPRNPPTTIVPYGPSITSTLAFDPQDGSTVTLEWATNILSNRNGPEYRQSVRSRPRASWQFEALLSDTQTRDVRARLALGAARARVFGLALTYEADYLTADSSGNAVAVAATSELDWAIPAQYVAILYADGSQKFGTIQTVGSTSIGLDFAPNAARAAGVVRICPVVPVYLADAQPMGRYAVNLERWQLKAVAASTPGYVNSSTIAGAVPLVFSGGDPLWDRGIVVNDTSSSSAVSEAELLDLGGLLTVTSSRDSSYWGRQISYKSARRSEWQWFKKFLAAVRGRNKRFACPSGRPDMVIAPGGSIGDGNITVIGGPVGSGLPDYREWQGSPAHAALWFLRVDGSVFMTTWTTATDLGGGLQRIALDDVLPWDDTASKLVCFLETCRLDTDQIQVTWNGPAFEIDVPALVVPQ